MSPFNPVMLLQLGARLHPCRVTPAIWNFTAGYAKSAEEKLGIEKPKKPATPFLRFVNQVRPSLLAKNPGTDAVGVIKLASKHWQQLGDDAKNQLSKEYERDVEAYKKRFAVYNSSLSNEQKEDIKKLTEEMATAKEKKKMKADLKELGKPKRPMSSYLLFLQSEKDDIKNIGFTEFQLKMKNKWYSMSNEEKAVFEKKAEVLKNSYRKELTKWEEEMIKLGYTDFVRNKTFTPVKKTKQPTA